MRPALVFGFVAVAVLALVLGIYYGATNSNASTSFQALANRGLAARVMYFDQTAFETCVQAPGSNYAECKAINFKEAQGNASEDANTYYVQLKPVARSANKELLMDTLKEAAKLQGLRKTLQANRLYPNGVALRKQHLAASELLFTNAEDLIHSKKTSDHVVGYIGKFLATYQETAKDCSQSFCDLCVGCGEGDCCVCTDLPCNCANGSSSCLNSCCSGGPCSASNSQCLACALMSNSYISSAVCEAGGVAINTAIAGFITACLADPEMAEFCVDATIVSSLASSMCAAILDGTDAGFCSNYCACQCNT